MRYNTLILQYKDIIWKRGITVISSSITWARVIEEVKDIPEYFMKSVQNRIGHQADFPYMVYVPENTWRGRTAPDQLLFIHEEKIYILEATGDEAVILCYPFKDITCMQHGKILLYSWITIEAQTQNIVQSTMIEYNTVVQEYFLHIINTCRQTIIKNDLKKQIKNSGESVYSISELICRWENYISSSILPGQEVDSAIFQPTIYKKTWLSARQIIVPSHLCILTQEELIIYGEEFEQEDTSRFGGIWMYIPLHKISTIRRIANNTLDQISIAVTLQDAKKIILIYALQKEKEVELFISRVNGYII